MSRITIMKMRIRNTLLKLIVLGMCGLILTACSKKSKGWTLTQYSDESGNQAMCYSLVDNQTNDLILIDGGWIHNQDKVKRIIDEHDGHVKAWFLTHFHGDHAGAFDEIYEQYREGIEKVYITPLVWDDFISVAQWWDTPETFEKFLQITEGDEKIVRLNCGEELVIDDFHIKNYNCYDEFVKSGGDIPNNCSLVLKFTADDKSILFCGDVHGEEMSKHLLEIYGDELKADIVQPGHHGNNSLPTDFYEFVNPKIVMFDAPEWLMTGKDYTAKDLKAWCDEKGISVYDYTSAPNVITDKDLE